MPSRCIFGHTSDANWRNVLDKDGTLAVTIENCAILLGLKIPVRGLVDV